jgi:hypothetical protein
MCGLKPPSIPQNQTKHMRRMSFSIHPHIVAHPALFLSFERKANTRTHFSDTKYTQNHGLSNAEVAQKILSHGPNAYTVPIPGFIELYLDQIRSPLFVFQVFSIFCSLLDEYWIYPLFSLASLLLLERTTVRTRQSNLLELRGVELRP